MQAALDELRRTGSAEAAANVALHYQRVMQLAAHHGKRAEDLGQSREKIAREALAIGGEPILWNGGFVGLVSSAAFGHTIDRTVAIGLVQAGETRVDEMVATGGFEIEIAGERFAAAASFRAPYDPDGEQLRG